MRKRHAGGRLGTAGRERHRSLAAALGCLCEPQLALAAPSTGDVFRRPAVGGRRSEQLQHASRRWRDTHGEAVGVGGTGSDEAEHCCLFRGSD